MEDSKNFIGYHHVEHGKDSIQFVMPEKLFLKKKEGFTKVKDWLNNKFMSDFKISTVNTTMTETTIGQDITINITPTSGTKKITHSINLNKK